MEEPGPELPFEDLPGRPRIDPDQLLLRVHLPDGRREDEVHALGIADGQVRVQGPRVLVEVLVRPELKRVHEDRDRDRASRARQLARAAQQRAVPVVQRAHGGHENSSPSGGTYATRRGGKLFQGSRKLRAGTGDDH